MNSPVLQLSTPNLQRCLISRGDFRNLQQRGAPPMRLRAGLGRVKIHKVRGINLPFENSACLLFFYLSSAQENLSERYCST